jgi:hypothetical protein
MKYCDYLCPVSLAELCIAERELDFACTYSLVPRRYVLFYGLRGLCVGRVDKFDRFRCEAPGRIRFDFWSGLRFLERTQ